MTTLARKFRGYVLLYPCVLIVTQVGITMTVIVSLPLPAAVGWIQRQEREVAVPGTYGSTQAAAHDAETAPGNPNITGDGVRRVF